MAFDRKKMQLDLAKNSLCFAYRELVLARMTLPLPGQDKRGSLSGDREAGSGRSGRAAELGDAMSSRQHKALKKLGFNNLERDEILRCYSYAIKELVASLKDRKFTGKVLHDVLTVLIEQEAKKDMEQDNAKVTPISDFQDDLDYTVPLDLGHALERIDNAIQGACLTAGKLQHMKHTNDVLKKFAGTFTNVARAVSEELDMLAHDTEYAAKAIAQKYNRPLPKKEAPAADIDLDGDDDTWKPMTVKALKKK